MQPEIPTNDTPNATEEPEQARKRRISLLASILVDEIHALAKLTDDTITKTTRLQACLDLMTASKRAIK